MTRTTVCVVGLGYIGLPTATLFARSGFSVHGMDVSEKAVEAIRCGKPHIVEPGLDEVVAEVVSTGRLTASRDVRPADVFLLAVPTPFKGDHEPDISYVEAATRSVAPHLKPGNLIVLESTSPVGTTERVGEIVREMRPDLAVAGLTPASGVEPVYVAHCPERVLPGHILHELVYNDRVVGGLDAESTDRAAAIYAAVVKGKILKTGARAAELSKLTENSFRDVNIAFANELSLVCERLGVNVYDVIALANHHPRVNILSPGPGVGGHCIAVDPWFIVSAAPEEARIIRMARDINDGRTDWVAAKVQQAAKEIDDPAIACFGLAYKADIDDLRESPSVKILQDLAARQAGRLIAVEPHVDSLPSKLAGIAQLLPAEQALKVADIIVLLVDHTAFKDIPASALAGKRVIDTRGIWTEKAAFA